jgi:chemotaxis protein MotB
MRTHLLKATTLGCGLALLVLGGCKSSLGEENAHLMTENQALRSQLVDRGEALDAAQASIRERDVRIAELELANAESWSSETTTYAAAPSDPFSQIEGVTGSISAGEVTATVESDVLFDSGKSTLKSGARQSLDAVAAVLKNDYSGRMIRVAGHTDTDPIKKSGFKSNYHLGFERAYAVREYLISRGVPTSNVYVASHGPDQARSSKSESRRVEIAVVLNE